MQSIHRVTVAQGSSFGCSRISVIISILFILLIIGPPAFGGKEDDTPKNTFTISLTGKYPPFSFYDENGELVGFDVDISEKIARHIGRQLVIVPTEWDGILAGLLMNKYDAIIGSMAITPQRAEKVLFSTPYYISGAQLFVHAEGSGKINDITDLYGQKVGVGLGETYEHYLREKHPQIDTVTYKSTTDIYQDMKNNRLRGFVTDRLVGQYQIKTANMPFVPVGELLYEEKMGIPVNKDNPELMAQINDALQTMRENGELEEIHQKWFGIHRKGGTAASGGMKTEAITNKLLHGFGVTLSVAASSFAIGFIFAVPCGLILNRRSGPLYFILRSINDFVRGTPLLIQLFFVYFGLPQIGVKLTPMQAAIITIAVNSSAYMAEVIRSGLMAVDPGQSLAARALGFSKLQAFWYIIWPQAFRVALPPTVNSMVALIKDTSLIAVIAVAEVIREAQSIISVTYNPIKYYFIVALMFFIFTFPLMKLAERLETKIKERGYR